MLLIEHCQNLARYQFPSPVILYPIHSNAPILKCLSNVQHLSLDMVERKKTPKVALYMLKLNTCSLMELNTFLWHKTWEPNHPHNEPYLHTTLLRSTQSFETQIRFILIIIIVNTSVKPWTSISTKGLHFRLHLADATFIALNKINRFVINRTFNLHFPINLITWKNNFSPPF